MIDDSFVRGTTAGPLVRLLREAGAVEVHVRVTSPAITHPCHMGVDMGTYDELISHRMNVKELGAHIGADSVEFLTLDGMMRAIGRDADSYCNACFTGCYPFDVGSRSEKHEFERVLG
jgi:amidophosphoribosyltransferase